MNQTNETKRGKNTKVFANNTKKEEETRIILKGKGKKRLTYYKHKLARNFLAGIVLWRREKVADDKKGLQSPREDGRTDGRFSLLFRVVFRTLSPSCLPPDPANDCIRACMHSFVRT